MTVHAPGKVILFGEYAVLEGHAAIVAAVNRHATAQWKPADNLVVSAPTIGVHNPDSNRRELPFINAVLDASPEFTGHFIVDTRAFRERDSKLGLGSSAAATVAFIATAERALGRSLNHHDVFVAAQNAHRSVQGMGSGADVAASTYGGVIKYRWLQAGQDELVDTDIVTRDGRARTTSLSLGIKKVLMVWSGQSASTPELVGQIHQLKDKSLPLYEEPITLLAEAANDASHAWDRQDRTELIRCAQSSVDALSSLGEAAGVPLVTDVHWALIEAVGDDGFVKPTGAGGGDLAWVIGQTEEQERRIHQRLTELGYQCIELEVDKSGVTERL